MLNRSKSRKIFSLNFVPWVYTEWRQCATALIQFGSGCTAIRHAATAAAATTRSPSEPHSSPLPSLLFPRISFSLRQKLRGRKMRWWAPWPLNREMEKFNRGASSERRKGRRIPILESTLVFAHYILFARELVAGLACCATLENNLNENLPKIDLRADHLMRYLANIVRGCLRRSKTPFAHSHNTGVALASDCLTAFSRVR